MDIRRWHVTDIYYRKGEHERALKYANWLINQHGWTVGDDSESVPPHEGCIQLSKIDAMREVKR